MKTNVVKALLTQLLLMSCLTLLWAQQGADTNQAPPAADNTKVNQRDRNQSEPTADQQKENSSDRQLVQQIRRALVKDKSLSTNAHNIKIIAQDGMVTLKGPVNSDSEKQAVEAKAAQIAGSDKVSSEIQIRSK
ncbi:MAG TPA: BON domain-containing protein [Terriglobales bacterium]|jgi:osmotically-inducible protein OsmY|nr:BON domain-containing protein [Terriglobales bacterium]